MDKPFPYAQRAAAAREAHAAIAPAFAALRNRNDATDPATLAWKRSIAAFHEAIDAAYPPGFWKALEALRAGRTKSVDIFIDFLAADPFFHRSGYVKAGLIQYLKRAQLAPRQDQRLAGVVTSIVLSRDTREFRHYGRLAAKVDCPELRETLRRFSVDADRDLRRRAAWMLAMLEQAARTERGRRRTKAPG